MSDAIVDLKRKKKDSGFTELKKKLGFHNEQETIASAAKKKLEIADIETQRREDNEKLQKADKLSVANIIHQCGLNINVAQFYFYSVLLGGAVFIIANLLGLNLILAGGLSFFFAFGVPRWYLMRIRAKRLKKFVEELPAALEMVVRNLKAGIPALEAIKILSQEGKEPLRQEFEILMREQALGLTLAHAFERLALRVPMEECRFLAITIEIQSKSGGNLSEVLSNLAKVLRERRALRKKIHSMTAESRAGAMIVGGIPFAILAVLAFLQPNHTDFFFTDTLGIFVITAAVLWQCLGIFVMWKMTNFKI